MWTRALCAAVVLLLAGCSSIGDSTSQFEQEALAAVSSADLAVTLAQRGSATWAVAETAVGDAVEQLHSAEKSVSELEAGSPKEAATRKAGLASIRSAVDAVTKVQQALQYGTPDDLDDAVDALAGVEKDLT